MTKARTIAPMAVVALLSASACSSSTQAAATRPEPPSTVLNGGAGLRVPFVADNGALTVTSGPSPQGIDKNRAAMDVHLLLGGWITAPPGQPSDYHPMSGTVTLVNGLGVAALRDRPAWIVPFIWTGSVGCPYLPPKPLPPWASHLDVVIITSNSTGSAIIYQGAGTGICGKFTKPYASTTAP